VREQLAAYYRLTKPGIIYGNLFTAAGGFLFGAITRVNIIALLMALVGMALVMGSACVINNYLDRDIDKIMKRTKRRALATGQIRPGSGVIYATVLAISGIAVLLLFTNVLTALLGIIGLISYAFIYTFAKRKTVHGTLIGTLPGALPPVAGYTAATGKLDSSALLLFIILVFWQMAHFYAIAIMSLKDYKAAKIPVMPAVYGIWITKVQLMMYTAAFLLSIVLLAKYSYAGVFYLAVMVPLSLWWLLVAVLGIWTKDDEPWARKIFYMSIFLLPAFGLMLSVNAWLP
jgi:protoheme IX farnesyltransferase